MLNKSLITENFIGVYDSVIPESLCKDLIHTFDTNKAEAVLNKGLPNFSQMLIKTTKELEKVVIKALSLYQDTYPEHVKWFPSRLFPNLECFRVKNYRANTEDRYDLHIDVEDKEMAVRYLSFLFYLSDGFEGGETIFPEFNIEIKPKAGRVLMFPPVWTHPHYARKVTGDKDKYVMSTYLHYQ